MTQQSQVWWSWPGGIGWSTSIPLKGGKRKTRKMRKSKKSTRRMRGGNFTNTLKRGFNTLKSTFGQKNNNNPYLRAQAELQNLRQQLGNLKKQRETITNRVRQGSAAEAAEKMRLNQKIKNMQNKINTLPLPKNYENY